MCVIYMLRMIKDLEKFSWTTSCPNTFIHIILFKKYKINILIVTLPFLTKILFKEFVSFSLQ